LCAALDLVLAADERVQLVLHRRLGEIAAELREQRRLFDARERRLLVEELNDILTDRVEPHPFLHEDGGGDTTLLTENAEQQVLGADVVVEQPIGFLRRPFYTPL